MKKWAHIILAIPAIIGGFAVYYSTSLGPFVGSDSVGYMVGAKNLLGGYGLNVLNPDGSYYPITLHPPLYSLSLAFMQILGFNLIDAARWLSILLMVATVSMLGFGLYRLSLSPVLAVTASLVIIFSPAMQEVFYLAMSDALSLFLTVSALFSLIRYLNQKHSLPLLIAFAVFSALLILTRYTGLAILPTGFLILSIAGTDPWAKRIKRGLGYVGLASIFCLPWIVYTYYAAGTLAGRDPANISGFWSALAPFRLNLVENIWGWLPFSQSIPIDAYRLKLFVITLLILFHLLLSAILIYRKQNINEYFINRVALIPITFLSYAGMYAFVFLIAYLLTRPTPDIDSRTLLPLFTTLVLAFFSTLWLWTQTRDQQKTLWLEFLPILFCALILADYAPVSLKRIANWHTNSSSNCANPGWQTSEVISAIMELPSSTPLIANEEACIYLHTGRRPYDLRAIQIADVQDIKRFGDNPADPLQAKFRDRKAALIITIGFNHFLESRYPVKGNQAIEALTAGLIAHPYHDGTIYFYP